MLPRGRREGEGLYPTEAGRDGRLLQCKGPLGVPAQALGIPIPLRPSCLCSVLVPPHSPLQYLWRAPLSEALSSLPTRQVGRMWMIAVASWFPISTSGMESAHSAPSASGEKQVVWEPCVYLLPSLFPSRLLFSPPSNPGALQTLMQPCTQTFPERPGATQIFAREKWSVGPQLLQIFQVLL